MLLLYRKQLYTVKPLGILVPAIEHGYFVAS
jgi:hypothetical protein